MNQQYDIICIQQYLEGKLDAYDMHKLERAALGDPMLQDAIEGFSISKTVNHKQLSLLQQRLAARVGAHQEEKHRFYFTGQRLAVASVAGVLMIVVGVLFWMMTAQTNSNQVKNSNQSEVLIQVQNKPKVDLVNGSIAPINGLEDYQDYLSVSGAAIAEGVEVHLSFSVKDKRPTNIKVISKSSPAQTEKIVGLILDGPSWEGSQGEIIIKF